MAKTTARLTPDNVRRYFDIRWPQMWRLMLDKKDPLPFTMTHRDLRAWIARHTIPARKHLKS